MAQLNSQIAVTLIDDVTGETFVTTQMPAADLPESFEQDTTLHLGDEDWCVVDAQPQTRAEYARTKSLTLRLRHIETISPKDILYSLPSICDAIPSVIDQPLSGGEFVLADDDWRQFEFVSNELAHEVDEEIAKIRLIRETATAEDGWLEIHVRTKPEMPLVCTLALADLASALNVSVQTAGLTYYGAQSRIADGYSLIANDGLSVYGVAPKGNVQVIAFGQYLDSTQNAESIDRLRTFAHDLNLDVVNWCSCVRAAPGDPLFISLLSADTT